MTKALALISGGLDSILAALIVKQQKACPDPPAGGRRIKVTGLAFKSLFFNPAVQPRGWKFPLKIIDFSKEHLKIVKNPSHGYGKRANPCIDCHLLMFKEAKKILKKESYDFIISGDVLGQRPFSQNKNSLALIEKEADLKGLILRPLSAKLLPLTIPEQKAWVKREKLLNISGRSRKTQLSLAKKFKIKNYSTPGTSCILTDPQFSKRLFKLLEINPKCNANDIVLLKIGRHFWRQSKRSDSAKRGRTLMDLIIVGRNHEENIKLKKLAQKNDIILELKKLPGPTVLIRPYKQKPNEQILEKAKELLLRYSQHNSSLSRRIILVHYKDDPL